MLREPTNLSNGSRKKIEQYSYCLTDKIGKGYSSIVYRGRNDDTSKCIIFGGHPGLYLFAPSSLTQTTEWLSRS